MDWHEVARNAVDMYAASQHQDELADAVELVASLNPSIIVEIGCDAGGTLYAWRQVCETVYGITLADNSYGAGGGGGNLVDHGATVLIGDSHDPSSYTWLRKELRGRPVDALVIDGDHSARGVLADFDTYSPMVRPGGLVLLHDIAVMNDPRAQVCLVWPELSTRYVHEEIRSTQHQSYGWGIIHIPPMKVGGAV